MVSCILHLATQAHSYRDIENANTRRMYLKRIWLNNIMCAVLVCMRARGITNQRQFHAFEPRQQEKKEREKKSKAKTGEQRGVCDFYRMYQAALAVAKHAKQWKMFDNNNRSFPTDEYFLKCYAFWQMCASGHGCVRAHTQQTTPHSGW